MKKWSGGVLESWSVGNIRRKLTTNKIVFALALYTMLFAPNPSAEAQQAKRIGILLSGSRTPFWGDVFRQALRELGYIDGQNIAIEYRTAEGRNKRQPEVARELVAMKVDVLVAAGGNDVTDALMRATKSIPIVMTAGSNPVARGMISSLARPGGNVTGITSNWDDLSGKRLELLKETLPKLARIAVLWSIQRRTRYAVEGEPNRGQTVEPATPFHADT